MEALITRLGNALRLPEDLRVPSHRELIDGLKHLEREFPAQIRVSTDGRSKKGKELAFVEIGTGERVIAVTAGAHSDEPTGIATCFYLIKNLLQNQEFKFLTENYKFVFHPMLDPDGAELNYTWAAKEFSFYEYLKNYYRNNIPSEDCEHGIPVSSGQSIRPELEFFKRNIDRFKGCIDYYITLHTTPHLGGSGFLLSAKSGVQETIDTLTKVCDYFGVPVMDVDTYGEDGLERIAPGFLTVPRMMKVAEKYRDNPEILSQIKMPTYEYVDHFLGAPICMISELPYIIDTKLQDMRESEVDLIDLKRRELEQSRKHILRTQEAVAELKRLGVDEENPWFRSAEFAARFALDEVSGQEAQLERYRGIKAKNYDLHDVQVSGLKAELNLHKLYIHSLKDRPEHRSIFDAHCRAFDEIYEQLESLIDYKVVPLTTQVRVQTAMILSGVVGV